MRLRTLVAVRIEAPESISIEHVSVAFLPSNWRMSPPPAELQAIGERWVRSGLSVCLRVPSAIIPQENNLLVNPSHPDFRKLRFSGITGFKFDPRMWK